MDHSARTQPTPPLDITEMVDHLISLGKITHQQYQQLHQTILADNHIDERERCQINRMFDAIRQGQVRILS